MTPLLVARVAEPITVAVTVTSKAAFDASP